MQKNGKQERKQSHKHQDKPGERQPKVKMAHHRRYGLRP